MTPEQEQKLFTTLGYIRKGVDENTRQIIKQNSSVAEIRKTVNRHEVFIGKIGVAVASITFVVTALINGAIVAWVKLWQS